MAKENNSSSAGGISALGALGLIFVVLKLIGTIDWSWWWVLLPFYGLFAIVFTIRLCCLPFVLIEKIREQAAINRRSRRP